MKLENTLKQISTTENISEQNIRMELLINLSIKKKQFLQTLQFVSFFEASPQWKRIPDHMNGKYMRGWGVRRVERERCVCCAHACMC